MLSCSNFLAPLTEWFWSAELKAVTVQKIRLPSHSLEFSRVLLEFKPDPTISGKTTNEHYLTCSHKNVHTETPVQRMVSILNFKT